MRFFLPLCVLSVAALAGEHPSLSSTVNGLDDSQVQKAIDTIKGNFLSAEALDDASQQRALLEGLAMRLGPGISLVAPEAASKPATPLPFLAEILDGQAGYMRPGVLDAATLTQVDAALKNFTDNGVPAVILDLRAVPAGGEYEMAAEFARRFTAKGKILFTIQKPNAKQGRILTSDKDPAFNGILIILTDSNDGGAVEALAAALRLNAKAMIVGAKTTGAAVEYAEFPLGGGRSMRIAVSRVSVPESGSIFPDGVKPDIQIEQPADVQARIFEMTKEKGVSRFVFDTDRPR